ncbi:dipeptide/oligopeptide/nickel ABC transporter permease/ATP-binding protein [Dactylosporangium sp. CA-092794]|uniref:dipeptide/oligopeptide/nickel ABC transporter permease/ATP-binding protein n=1 Tax=Dactylosporangium sp. CA-092794 TaxID=3239929 RepID=UPI003D91E5DA
MRRHIRTVFSTVAGSAATVLLLALVVLAIVAPMLWSRPAAAIHIAEAWQPPSGAHWLGTDELGRDVFARTLVATRLSLVCAVVASGIAIVIGIPIGLLASAFGPRLTGGFQSVVNVAIAFPALLTAMFVGTVIGIGVPGAVLGVGIALAPVFARLTQTLTASVASLDYVAAARTMGVPLRRVVSRHILANVAEPLVISATTSVGTSLLGISALSFLGLGARPPQYDWGGLLSTGLRSIYTSPLAAIGPGALIALTGIVFSLLGEVIAGSFGDNQSNRRVGRVARTMAAAARGRPMAAGTRAPDALLEVENLRVSFPAESGELPAVRGVSLRLAPGERVGIVGESGSGKSVSAMAIAQLVEHPAVATADRLRFLGNELSTMDPQSRRRFLGTNLAMVFQNPMSSLNPAMRIGAQLTEAARAHSRLSRAQARARAADRLAEVGIADAGRRLRQYPHQFSGGMRQRAMIAMGLMETPRLIIADEPTTALDVTVQRQILDLLLDINRTAGTAILLISHDISVIANVCERVVVMYAGKIVEDLPTGSLLQSAAHPYTRALIASVPDMATDRSADLATVRGRPPALDDLPAGCPFTGRCPVATARCAAEMPPLAPLSGDHLAACWHPQADTTLADTRAGAA